MEKRFKILAVLLLILFVFSSNVVFAADMNDNADSSISVQSDDSDIISEEVLVENEFYSISQSEDNGASQNSTFSDLANLISSADGNLTLTQDYVYDSTVDSDYAAGIVINKTMTIDGAGYTINASNLARMFNVTASDVVIKNINFINGYYNNGSGQAGCVLWDGDNGELTNCNFTDSYAKISGAVLWLGDNGLVDKCSFTANSAMTTAGAIYWDGANGRINNSYFSKNHVTTKGGALYSSYNDNFTVENCIFDSNYALLYAGAIAFDYVSANIINSTFNGNYLVWSLNGGAIQFTGNSSNLCTLTDCTFDSNMAGSGSSVYSTIPLKIENSTFSDKDNSKAVVTTSDITLSGNTLNNNNTVYVNDGVVLSSTNIVLSSSSQKPEVGTNVTLSGKIYDDNNNTIILNSISFIVNNESISATFATDGTFTADYTIENEGSYNVTVNTTDKLADSKINDLKISTPSSPEIGIEIIYATEPTAIVKVSSDVSGNYTVTVGDESMTVKLYDKEFLAYTLEAGNYTVTVMFDGDDTYSKTSKTLEFAVVSNQVATVMSITSVNGDFVVTGVLKDINGNAVEGAVINYSVDGVENSTVSDSNGEFSLQAYSNSVVKMAYEGSDAMKGSEVNITFNVFSETPSSVQVESMFNILNNSITIEGYAVDTKAGEQGMKYATELLDVNGNPIGNVLIQFAVNNKIYNRTTYENGSFDPYNLNMNRAGRYTLAFSFGGNENYTSTFAVVCIDLAKKPLTIKASAKTYKVSATKKYTVTLSTIAGSSADGNVYLRSGLKVTLSINGKDYTSKINGKGQATFNIKITKRGTYTAKITTAEDSTYKTTTKSVKITVK